MVTVRSLGLAPYDEVRQLQERLIEDRLRERIPDTVLLCEHPATLTLGKRTKESEVGLSELEWRAKGVHVRKVDRGGSVTLHVPGQLVIYPVVNLRALDQGAKKFVWVMLTAIGETAREFSRELEVTLDPVGLWTAGREEKVGFAGLRISRGVTDHGFSINLNCDTQYFKWFAPCGIAGVTVGSLFLSVAPDEFGKRVCHNFSLLNARLTCEKDYSRAEPCMRKGTAEPLAIR